MFFERTVITVIVLLVMNFYWKEAQRYIKSNVCKPEKPGGEWEGSEVV